MLVSKDFRWRHVGARLRSRLKIAKLINGCGPKGGSVARFIPSGILGLHVEEFCDWHDFNYLVGGKEADRLKADWQFYESLHAQAIAKTESPWRRWIRPLYTFVAWTVYRAVRIAGRNYFHYGRQRTEQDVMLLLATEERRLGIAA